MNQLIDTVIGQLQNALPDLEVCFCVMESEQNQFPIYRIEIVDDAVYSMSLLVVTEMNIKFRQMTKSNATFLIRSKQKRKLLNFVDALAVCYGSSSAGGEFWEDSLGNKRLGYVGDVCEGPFGFDEIKTTFTEHNIQLMWKGEKLEDVCDYSQEESAN